MTFNIVIRKDGLDLEGTKEELGKYGKFISFREESNWSFGDDYAEDAVVFAMDMSLIGFNRFYLACRHDGMDLYKDTRKEYANYYYPAV